MMDRIGVGVATPQIYEVEKKPIIPITDHPSIPAASMALPAVPPLVSSLKETSSIPEFLDQHYEQQDKRRSRSSNKRVVIADPPVSGSQSPSRTKSKSRLVSYQRPRSPSMTTRLLQATQRVNSTFTERKTMENLTASMRSASELLERRRAEGSSGYSGTSRSG